MSQRNGGNAATWKNIPLLNDGQEVMRSPDPAQVKISGISFCALSSGRLIVAASFSGPGVRKLHGAKGRLYGLNHWLQTRLLVSCDKGENWTGKHDLPFTAPCLFRDGNSIYITGHKGNLQIARSADGGESWSNAADLTQYNDEGALFVQTPAAVSAYDQFIYMCFMRSDSPKHRPAVSGSYVPEILRAPHGADLLSASSWTRARGEACRDLFNQEAFDHFRLPAYEKRKSTTAPAWGNPLLFPLPAAAGTAPENTLLLLAQSGAENINCAVAATVRFTAGDQLTLKPLVTPAGNPCALWPCPGGNNRFELFYDEPSARYWLIAFTSGSPDKQRGLNLWSSTNLTEWTQAALLTVTPLNDFRINFVRSAIRGNDLLLLAHENGTAGNEQATTRLMLYTLPAFRDLL